VLDPDQRSEAFFKLHLEWFREWGLERTLLEPLNSYPLVSKALSLLAFRQARGKNDEGAELYVRSDECSGSPQRNAVIALRIQRFEQDDKLAAFLRHEFTHLNDMLDPAFGYSPFVQQRGPSPTEQRLTRERYRLLWDITIDGRLARSRGPGIAPREHHQALFDRAYSFWPEGKRREVFEELWKSASPRHVELLALASDPRDFAQARAAMPGAPCPLCTFPTFQWANPSSFTLESIAVIQTQFPQWRPEYGACARCLETYEVMLGMTAGIRA